MMAMLILIFQLHTLMAYKSLAKGAGGVMPV